MDLNHPDSTDGQPENPQEGLLTVLDPGLFGDHAQERYALLRGALADAKGDPPDLAALDALMDGLQKRRVRIQDALQEYAAATDARRWPIFAVRPNTDHKKLEDRLLGMGFQIVPSLASAYREVGLIPLRVPPEAALLAQLGRRPDIQRVERAWLKAAAPRANPQRLTPRRSPPSASSNPARSPRSSSRRATPSASASWTPASTRATRSSRRASWTSAPSATTRSASATASARGTASAGVIARLCPSGDVPLGARP
jgi:hypothetical protein